LVWDTRSAALVRRLNATGAYVNSMDWSRTGQLAAVGDDQVYIWQSMDADTRTVLDLPHMTTVKWSPNGNRLAVASQDGSITIWEQG
jgi:WD40 repeat protein